METEDEWSPYLSPQDAYKLDDAREALRRGDLKAGITASACSLYNPSLFEGKPPLFKPTG